MKNPLFDQDYIEGLPRQVYENLGAQNTFITETIAKRINEIGKLTPSDAHRLSAAYYAGADMERINKEIARITKLNLAEIDRIYEQVAVDNLDFSQALYDFRKVSSIPFAQNATMQSMVYAMAKVTKGEYNNLSRTAGFVSRDGKPMTIRQQYIKAVDKAITSVSTGTTDYRSAMRSTLKEMADSGYRTINYESGYSRRLDTAVRQNILTGVKDISQEMQSHIGQALGCDGYEISYHRNPRPTHSAMGGMQYSREQYYKQGIDLLLSEYNCYHFAFDIIMGVSEPNYTPEELARLKADDRRTYEWNGKQVTGYEATQIQRKYETKLRHLKDEANTYKAAGDDTGRRLAQSKINAVSKEYADFSKSVGLSVKKDRMSVAGFKPVRKNIPQKGLTNIATDSTIKSRNLDGNFQSFIEKQNTDKAYKEALSEKFKKGTDLAKEVFIKNVPFDSVADYNFKGTAHYNLSDGKIKLNAHNDMAVIATRGDTFFHEHGHLIDCGVGREKLSTRTADFRKALERDYRKYLFDHMKVNNVVAKQAYIDISQELSASPKNNGVSDIFGGLSNNKCVGRAGHRNAYWKEHQDLVPIEAFAEMYTAHFDTEQYKAMEKYFPTAFSQFNQLLGELK